MAQSLKHGQARIRVGLGFLWLGLGVLWLRTGLELVLACSLSGQGSGWSWAGLDFRQSQFILHKCSKNEVQTDSYKTNILAIILILTLRKWIKLS